MNDLTLPADRGSGKLRRGPMTRRRALATRPNAPPRRALLGITIGTAVAFGIVIATVWILLAVGRGIASDAAAAEYTGQDRQAVERMSAEPARASDKAAASAALDEPARDGAVGLSTLADTFEPFVGDEYVVLSGEKLALGASDGLSLEYGESMPTLPVHVVHDASPVPEPRMIALLAVGGAAILLRRRRSRRTR